MFLWMFKPLKFLTKAFLSEDTPRQMAFGLALGMVVGMVPKGNLLAVVLVMLMFSTRANLGVGMISAFLFTWVGAMFDGISHQVGLRLLSLESMQSIWTSLYELPLMPWTAFNHTTVLGSFVLSLYMFYPVYLVGIMVFERYQPWVKERVERYKVAKTLRGAEVAERIRTVTG